MGLVLSNPDVGPQRRRNRHVPGELREHPAWRAGSSGTDRNFTHASMVGGPAGAFEVLV